MRTIILIPALDLADRINGLLREIRRTAPDAGVLVIDDGSTDGTAAAAAVEGVEVVSHDRNRGKGAALKTGFERALREGYEALITIDGDGQHPPRLIPEFRRRADESGADLVVGTRFGDLSRMPRHRRFSNRMTSWAASRAAGRRLPDSQSGYRWIRAEVIRSVPLRTDHYETETELLIGAARRGFRIESVPIPTVYGDERSHIRLWRDTWRFLRLLASLGGGSKQ